MNVLSSDLVAETKKHINFLQRLQKAGVFLSSMSPIVTPMMMDRYLNKWLPLVAALTTAMEDDDDKSSLMMIPPPDVAWMWYCHRLSPHYESYTIQSFGKVIEAYPTFSFQMSDPRMAPPLVSKTESDAAVAMKASWERVYSNDSFYLDTATVVPANARSSNAMNNHQHDLCGHKLDNFDLATFCASQAKFLIHVSQLCCAQDQYLCHAVDKYHKFLQLLSTGPLVPTSQIDLVWRTHVLVSLCQYHKDCILIHGSIVAYQHHESIILCSPGAKFDRAHQTTRDLWERTYGEPYDDGLWKQKYMPIIPMQTSGTIWEFQENNGTWTKYGKDQQNILEEAYINLHHATSASCKVQIKGGPWTYEVDVQTMKQTNVEHEDHTQRNIQRRNLSGCGFCWEYHNSNNMWEPYSPSDQK